jgi:hypothetical protein
VTIGAIVINVIDEDGVDADGRVHARLRRAVKGTNIWIESGSCIPSLTGAGVGDGAVAHTKGWSRSASGEAHYSLPPPHPLRRVTLDARSVRATCTADPLS